jgi:murein DD-endopeptidase MepM/ murein hydrolase activator NlpD
VLLAHLQHGSVAVATGDPVTVGDPIGRVGNSGNTTEPHLHIHAFDPRTGEGVPIRFDGGAPLRNRVFGT